MDGIERPVPYELQAEEAVLGSLLLDRDAIVKVATFLKATDFHREANGCVYQAVLDLYKRREPPDSVTLSAELERRGWLEPFGGYSALVGLINRTPTAVHIEHYARLIERASVLRQLISAGGEIAGLGYGEWAEGGEAVAKAQELLNQIGRGGKRGYVTMEQAVGEFYDRWEYMLQNPDRATGVPTGFFDIDERTGGLQKGDVIILAGRPGFGKSSLAWNIGLNATGFLKSDGMPYKPGIFSFEMSRDQLVMRAVATRARVDSQKLRMGKYLTEAEEERVTEAIGYVASKPVLLSDDASLNISTLRAEAHRMAAEGLDLLIIDYVQLVAGSLKRDRNRQEEVSEVSRGLKLLAGELQIPLIECAQLSRSVEGRSDHVPLLSDLRESGSLEQDSDVVIFIHRPDMYPGGETQKGIAELYFAKHRNGPLGKEILRFDAKTTTFHNYVPDRQYYGRDDDE